MEELLRNLSPEQREAVTTTEGPVLVVAGAGSGKTRVLTHRIAYLIARGVPPSRILAITFTNKAAREMKERSVALVGEAALEVWISTFHSLAARLLRIGGEAIGLPQNFTILDTDDVRSLFRQILEELNLDPKREDPRHFAATISRLKNEGTSPEDYLKRFDPTHPAERRLAQIYLRYEEKKAKAGSLDFDDLLLRAVELLEHEAGARLAARFRYIHVDEYQDTNPLQYRLLRALTREHDNLFVVGDADQSIYTWRGADPRIFHSFAADYPGAKVITLERNYRSTQRILDAANALIRHNPGRPPKDLWTENDGGEPVRVLFAGNQAEEAEAVVKRIDALTREGYALGDIAVLYRTNGQSRTVEEALLSAGIPYRIVGGLRFYERKEIKDILAYLRLIANPGDDLSFLRVVNEPRRGLGESTLARLRSFAESMGSSLFLAACRADEADIPRSKAKVLIGFCTLLRDLGARARELPLARFVDEVLEATGYRASLLALPEPERAARLENVQEFLNMASSFQALHPEADLASFLSEMALLTDVDTYEGAEDRVTLLTLHAAKGLEFPVVFIIGLEEGLLPHHLSLEEGNVEEERRLLYVGMTRAKERLFLTYAEYRAQYGSPLRASRPSRFLEEIPPELLVVEDVRVPWAREIFRRRGFPPAGEDEREIAGISGSPFSGHFGGPREGGGPGREGGKANLADEPWQPGDRLVHALFGEGTVVQVRGRGDEIELVVAFPQPLGVRILLPRFAPIIRRKGS
ncbi:MAG: UvrD-helicase domain-containing protein [Brockia lithotrophica]|nr:UvrD-helicase domain-containing protein [Brockia lithotrophica]MBT9253875.1 UvrD-helicase domain-containing protein [Brockia lithotrophica]